jgi:7-keto-8-aminopelargonate synthetase-like enzyme
MPQSQNENLNRFKIVIAIVLIPARHAVTEIIRNSPTNNHSTKLLEKKLLLLKGIK